MSRCCMRLASRLVPEGTAPQEAALELYTQFNCCVVFLGAELKEKYYKGQPRLAIEYQPLAVHIRTP